MLGMSQTKLAEASRVSLRSILDFEVGKRQPIAANLAAICSALEAAGAEFIPENGGGPGVRLRSPAMGSKDGEPRVRDVVVGEAPGYDRAGDTAPGRRTRGQ
jgi:transcriptional regulator with XRE-family HTH domain